MLTYSMLLLYFTKEKEGRKRNEKPHIFCLHSDIIRSLLPPTPPSSPAPLAALKQVEEIFSQLSASVLTGSHRVNQDEGTKLGGYGGYA